MVALEKRLIAERGITESSAKLYITNLYTLNGKRPFKTLSFLRDTDSVVKRLDEYANTTQCSMLGSVISTLTFFKDSRGYKKAYVFYEKLATERQKVRREANATGEMTEKQKENWMEWKDVQKLAEDSEAEAIKIGAMKLITSKDWENLLKALLLALYTRIQPRRNMDYSLMCISHDEDKPERPDTGNYLVMEKGVPKEFIFNVYKTSKKYGQQKVAIENENLKKVLAAYVSRHPAYLSKKRKDWPPHPELLVGVDGAGLNKVNGITRVLNRVFGKKVGCSMLRHIFLSDKYDLAEMEADASAMAHSTSQQRQYLKHSESAPPVEA